MGVGSEEERQGRPIIYPSLWIPTRYPNWQHFEASGVREYGRHLHTVCNDKTRRSRVA
jgi:hypothetical protein